MLIAFGSLLAGVVALYDAQLSYGTYLGPGWVISAVAGMITAFGLGAAVWTSNRRHLAGAFRLNVALLVVASISASAIRIPFPRGPYGKVMEFFNVAHAAMLGFDAVAGTAIFAITVYALMRHRSGPRHGESHAGLVTGRAGGPDGADGSLHT